jgi:hypothetical protein
LAPLLNPILLPYLALVFGGVVAAIAGSYNALVLKRFGLVLRSLLVGLASSLCFVLAFAILRGAGVENRSVALIAGRLTHFAFGGVLYFIHRPHFRGHEFLGGTTVPLLPSYLVAIVVSLKIPGPIAAMLLGAPFVR